LEHFVNFFAQISYKIWAFCSFLMHIFSDKNVSAEVD